MNSRGKEDHVGAKHLLDKSNWDSRCLVNNEQFRLAKLSVILGLDVLDSLPMVFEHVDSDYSVVKVRVSRLQDVIVSMLAVIKCIQAFEKELENSG